MAKRMLIDSTHPEETRVVVVNGTRLEQLDVETSTKKQLKGNIYLAKVVRVEPSLQAAFVDYGGNRHGFLAFSEIHPDYYQIPVADRQALIDVQEHDDDDHGDGETDVETLGGDDAEEVRPRPRAKSARDYKIQEVIKRKQILLVQVVKEERGNKGAALTTYLSLAGRYCVLMPNTARGGGVSRKITNIADRKRLKTIMGELDIPSIMAVIVRTAGQERSKAEIKRDYEYLMRTWNQIRETTLESRAPCLIHEEGNLIKRAIRDVYTSDIEEVLVDGDDGYRLAKDFMKILTPSHAKKVQPYRDHTMPLFHRYQVDSQLDAMHSPTVQLRSGGYLVINQTEALVAIDVNSGRATKERHIEETAVKTNLEAAEEIARQLRLRDLAGLVVIDFIDMEENRNNVAVERKLKDALKQDRARIQLGRISPFGLMEMSRQRLRPSLMETSFEVCPHCGGAGMIRSVESAAVHILRVIEEEGVRRRSSEVALHVATPVALYILNHKRRALAEIETRYDFSVTLLGDDTLIPPDYRMERIKADTYAEPREAAEAAEPVAETVEPAPRPEDDAGTGEATNGDGKRRRKRRKRRRKDPSDGVSTEAETQDTQDALDAQTVGETDAAEEAEDTGEADEAGDDKGEPKRRRRSRRGGRRRRKTSDEEVEQTTDTAADETAEEVAAAETPETDGDATPGEPAQEATAAQDALSQDSSVQESPVQDTPAQDEAPKPRRRRTRRVAKDATTGDATTGEATSQEVAPTQDAVAPEVTAEAPPAEATPPVEAEDKPKPRRRTRRKKEEAPAPEADAMDEAGAGEPSTEAAPVTEAVVETAPVEMTEAETTEAEMPSVETTKVEDTDAESESDAAPVPMTSPDSGTAPPAEDKPVQIEGAAPDATSRRKGWWQKLVP